MARERHLLQVVERSDLDQVLEYRELPKVGYSEFDDLVCGAGDCGFVLMPKTSLFDAQSLVGRTGRTLAKCPKCASLNLLSTAVNNSLS